MYVSIYKIIWCAVAEMRDMWRRCSGNDKSISFVVEMVDKGISNFVEGRKGTV